MNLHKKKCGYGSFVICLISVFTLWRANAGGYQVKGILNIKILNEENKIISERDESFDVSVNGSQWFIATAAYPPSDKEDIANWEIGSEGSNEIYQVSLYNKARLNSKSLNDSVGMVEEDDVPLNLQGNQASELWLAFASSRYFDGITNGMLKPVYDLPNWSLRAQGYSDHATYERFESEPKLPKQVAYLNDKFLGLLRGKPKFIQLPAPFEKGFTRAEYKVILSTNVNGLMLPIEFTFTENAVLITKQKVQLLTYRIVDGTVTNLVPECNRESFIPNLTKATYIDDRRFDSLEKPVGALAYMVTNEIWPPMSSAFLQNLYKHEINVRAHMISTNLEAPIGLNQHTKARKIVVILLFIPSLIILTFLLKNFSGGKQKQIT